MSELSEWQFADKIKEQAKEGRESDILAEIADRKLVDEACSYHTHKFLLQNELLTVRDLWERSEDEIRSLPDCERKIIAEIKRTLARYGLKLGMSFGQEPLPFEEFSIRTANNLKYSNIYTTEQLAAKTETEILRIPNMGRKSLNELKVFLQSRGLSFGTDWEALRVAKELEEFERSMMVEQVAETEIETETQPQTCSTLPPLGEQNLSESIETLLQMYAEFYQKIDHREQVIFDDYLNRWDLNDDYYTPIHAMEKMAHDLLVTKQTLYTARNLLIRKLHHSSRSRAVRRVFGLLFRKYGSIIAYEEEPYLQKLRKYFGVFRNISDICYTNIMPQIGVMYSYDSAPVDVEFDFNNIGVEKIDNKLYRRGDIEEQVAQQIEPVMKRRDDAEDNNFRAVVTCLTNYMIEQHFTYDMNRGGYYTNSSSQKDDVLTRAFYDAFPNGVDIHKDKELVFQKMKAICPNFKIKTPTALAQHLVTFAKDIILSKPGFYIHIDRIEFPPEEVLNFALEKCREKLKKVSKFKINEIFDENSYYFQSNKIATPQLLNSLLQRIEQNDICFKRMSISLNEPANED